MIKPNATRLTEALNKNGSLTTDSGLKVSQFLHNYAKMKSLKNIL